MSIVRTVLLLFLFLTSCCVHRVLDRGEPPVCIPEEYSQGGAVVVQGKWWEEFGVEGLNELVECVQKKNWDLKAAWARLAQAKAATKFIKADLFPQVNTAAQGSNQEVLADRTNMPSGVLAVNDSDFYLLGTQLTYEVDLWRRISYSATAARLDWEATYEDYEATALLLSGSAFDLWLTIQEQRALLLLLDEQIASNRIRVELLELRFSLGLASALDVYQQRLQLASTVSLMPVAESLLRTSWNQLLLLMGLPPNQPFPEESPLLSIELPPLPELGVPKQLLSHRPDLRALQRRVMAADYEVGAAIANRMPRVDISLGYAMVTTIWRQLFQQELSEIAWEILEPIFDGGKRVAEQQRREAILTEEINLFSQTFLTALQEVENALIQEKYQIEFLEQIELEIEIAEKNVSESTRRYVNGLVNYLDVIAANQSLQNLQRTQIFEHKKLLQIRGNLYRALGGSRTEKCESTPL